jgi:3,4-dihydroxyphthalate decarboxylase
LTQDELLETKREVALACRVLAHRGLVEDVLGHISVRVGPDRVLLRCRGPHERGLRFTVAEDVRLVDLDGAILDLPDGTDAGAGFSVPAEAPIHLETLRRHPHVQAVVHAHPPAVVVAGLARIPLVPLYGSYDIPGARLAAGGIAVYERSVLIRRVELAAELLDAMGDAPACLLRGHGLVTTGADAAEAVLRALAVDRLCRISGAVVAAGASPEPIPAADLAELPDLGAAFNVVTLWRHHLACLAADGWAEQDDPPGGTR